MLLFSICITSILPRSDAQNLPSLRTERPVYATFSIVAFDEATQEWGIAVATNNLYVGSSTVYIEPGVGAFSVIAETHPPYATNGFERLKAGASIEEAIEFTRNRDPEAHFRQVAGMDHLGNGFAFTGAALQFWYGQAAHRLGKHYVVLGNQLDSTVLEQLALGFERATGTLAERLLSSLLAGQLAGGQVSGKQSAALVVKGTKNEWYNQIDLRVDHSQTPFRDLQRLLDFHYGRIQLNQSIYAAKVGNRARAIAKLHKAEQLLQGWNGIYGKIALAYSLLGDDQLAVTWIQKALLENPQWAIQLPAFYYLRTQAALTALINPQTFTPKDWQSAAQMYLHLNRPAEAVELIQQLIAAGTDTSYLRFLQAKSYAELGKQSDAIAEAKKALHYDASNVEAALLLAELTEEKR